jgi:transcriptional regulator with XRE-family HTH domain
MVEDLTPLARELKATRRRRRLSLAQIEERTGISRSTVSLWERGRHRPSAALLVRLAETSSLTAIERENWLILAGYRTPAGEWVDDPDRPERPTDPLTVIVDTLRLGPWSDGIKAAVFTILRETLPADQLPTSS